ncbi:MAG TPA: NADH-quinone oxidoreductase subunit NuoF [Anaerolineales bacterium]|jgi:NADH-quinone oxidoreductase subunit F|nr:NADH-quinone oxidoreductase subunit NuoF [Anaerolineales bacterium]
MAGQKVTGHRLLLRHRDIPDIGQFDVYTGQGGFETFKKVVTSMPPDEIKQIVLDSGLRGRGGAGFPAGRKWMFVDNNNWPHYLVVNADESEPGTFKDREIMEKNPWQFFEGIMCTAFAIGANDIYIYLRGEFWQVAHQLDQQIQKLHEEKLLGENLFGTDYSLNIYTHLGAGAYICGEETALLNSMEGIMGQPRLRPPFPPAVGLYNKPTVVNNVETLANVALILEKGAQWYRSFGTEESAGTKVFSLSGKVNKPGNYELPFGATYRELIYEYGGGIVNGNKIKGIMSAGASSSVIVATDEALDTPMAYETVRNLGADLGSASIIVLDETVDMRWLVNKTIHFFKHESCGKCTPCREGNFWMQSLTERIWKGGASQNDVHLLQDVATNMQGKCLCALGEFSTMAVISSIERFSEDFKV